MFDGTEGLEAFSHMMVTWWCHLYDTEDNRKTVLLEKPYKKGSGKSRCFATRSPVRPNPIAITPCYMAYIDPEEKRIYIPYMDAEAGTPVLDIKPYQPCIDRVRDYEYPEWASH